LKILRIPFFLQRILIPFYKKIRFNSNRSSHGIHKTKLDNGKIPWDPTLWRLPPLNFCAAQEIVVTFMIVRTLSIYSIIIFGERHLWTSSISLAGKSHMTYIVVERHKPNKKVKEKIASPKQCLQIEDRNFVFLSKSFLTCLLEDQLDQFR
jgi:hypothetical protein